MLVAKPGKQGGSSYMVYCFRNSYQSKGLIAELAPAKSARRRMNYDTGYWKSVVKD